MSEELSGMPMSPITTHDEPASPVPELSLRTDQWQPRDFLRQAVQDISNFSQQASMVMEKMGVNPSSAGQVKSDGEPPRSSLNLNSPTALPLPASSFGEAALDYTRRWEGHNTKDVGLSSSSPAFSASLGSQPSVGKWIKELSSMANVVVGRCAR